MKRILSLLISIVIIIATLGSVFVFAVEPEDQAGSNNSQTQDNSNSNQTQANEAQEDGASNQTKKTILVGAVAEASPFSNVSEKDSDQVMTYIFSKVFGKNAELIIMYYESYADMQQALTDGAIDVAFPCCDNGEKVDGIAFSQSITMIDASMVYQGNKSSEDFKVIAVCKSGMSASFIQATYIDCEKYLCETPEDCIKAIDKGKADFTIATAPDLAALEPIMEKYYAFNSSELPLGAPLCIAVKEGNADLLKQINKGINKIDSQSLNVKIVDIQTSMINAASKGEKKTVGFTTMVIIAIIIAFVLIVFALVVIFVPTVKKMIENSLEKKNKNNELSRKIQKQQAKLSELKDEVNEKLDEVTQIREETETIKQENESIKQENQEMKRATINLQVENTDYKRVNSNLENMLNEKQYEVEELAKLVVDAQIAAVKVEAPKVKNPENVDMRTVIKGVLPDIKAMTEAAGIHFKLDISNMSDPRVICDIEMLNGVILDMIFASLRNSQPDSKLVFKIAQTGRDEDFASFELSSRFNGSNLSFASEGASNLGGIVSVDHNKDGETILTVRFKFLMVKQF